MAPVADSPIKQLPLVPETVLKTHRVFEKFDTRFRACARLLQALWREQHELPIGTYRDRAGKTRRIGSLISGKPAEIGRNFLTPAIAELARLEVAYQERGALIDRERLYGNLLSSMPLTFNMAAPWRFDLPLAAKIWRTLLPQLDIAAVKQVWFEHSPGRQDPSLTNDRTAFDVALVFERSDGGRGLIAIEVKYSESGNEPAPSEISPSYDALSEASGLFKEPRHAALRVAPLQQLFREHLLAQASLMRGDYSEAHFVVIAPEHNHLIHRSAELYGAFLAPLTEEQAGFHHITLEQVIEATGWAGEAEHARALYFRYCDWWAVDAVVRHSVQVDSGDWRAVSSARNQEVALIGKAA